MLARILQARDDLAFGGAAAAAAAPVTYAVLGRLKARERAAALQHLDFRAAEIEAIAHLEARVAESCQRSDGAARPATPAEDAYAFLEKTAGGSAGCLLWRNHRTPRPWNKIRNYLHNGGHCGRRCRRRYWNSRALGMARGPKFDEVIEDLFQQQLHGKGRRRKIAEDSAEARRDQGSRRRRSQKREKKKRGREIEQAGCRKGFRETALRQLRRRRQGSRLPSPAKPGHAAAHQPAPPAKGSKPRKSR